MNIKRDLKIINQNGNKIKSFKSRYKFVYSKLNGFKENNKILIAPTWNTTFYEENFLEKLLRLLKVKRQDTFGNLLKNKVWI